MPTCVSTDGIFLRERQALRAKYFETGLKTCREEKPVQIDQSHKLIGVLAVLLCLNVQLTWYGVYHVGCNTRLI